MTLVHSVVEAAAAKSNSLFKSQFVLDVRGRCGARKGTNLRLNLLNVWGLRWERRVVVDRFAIQSLSIACAAAKVGKGIKVR